MCKHYEGLGDGGNRGETDLVAANLEMGVQVAHWGETEDHHILRKGITEQDPGSVEKGGWVKVDAINLSQLSGREEDTGK